MRTWRSKSLTAPCLQMRRARAWDPAPCFPHQHSGSAFTTCNLFTSRYPSSALYTLVRLVLNHDGMACLMGAWRLWARRMTEHCARQEFVFIGTGMAQGKGTTDESLDGAFRKRQIPFAADSEQREGIKEISRLAWASDCWAVASGLSGSIIHPSSLRTREITDHNHKDVTITQNEFDRHLFCPKSFGPWSLNKPLKGGVVPSDLLGPCPSGPLGVQGSRRYRTIRETPLLLVFAFSHFLVLLISLYIDINTRYIAAVRTVLTFLIVLIVYTALTALTALIRYTPPYY